MSEIKLESRMYKTIDGVQQIIEIKSRNGMYYSENQDNEKIDVLEKHIKIMQNACKYDFQYHIGKNIPIKKAKNALDDVDFSARNTLIAIYDTTLFNNGKKGYFFTNDKLYLREAEVNILKSICYADVKEIETIINNNECVLLHFKMDDGNVVEVKDNLIDKLSLKECLKELITLSRNKEKLICTIEDITVNKQESDFTYEEQSFSQKHPIVSGAGKLLKNIAISAVGDTLGMSNSEIENLKKSDAVGVLETLMGYSESCKDDIAEYKKKKAFEERGMDYDLYQSMSSFEKSKYLNTHTKSKTERELFEKGIEELDEEYSIEEYDDMYYDEEKPSYLETEEEN